MILRILGNMGNSSTKLAEKCSLLSKNEVPVVASSFKLVSKNSERIKEDDLMVGTHFVYVLCKLIKIGYSSYSRTIIVSELRQSIIPKEMYILLNSLEFSIIF